MGIVVTIDKLLHEIVFLASGEDKGHIDRRLFAQYCQVQHKLIQLYEDIDHLQGDNSPTDIDTQVTVATTYTEPQKKHRNFNNSIRYGKQSIYVFSLNYKF